MRQGSIITKITYALLMLFLLAYVLYQAWGAIYNPVRTVSAVYAESYDSMSATGWIVRDESVLVSPGQGTILTVVDEGERVAKGDPVVSIYESESALENSIKAQESEKTLARLKKVYVQSDDAYDVSSADSAIFAYARSLASAVDTKEGETIASQLEELKYATLSREYIYRDKSELETRIDELTKEIKQLNANRGAVKRRIYAPAAGYFSNGSDGLEQALSSSSIENVSPSEFEQLLNKKSDLSGAIGKLIAGYTWHYAVIMSDKQAQRLSQGENVSLEFQGSMYPSVAAEVERISESENSRVLVCFRVKEHMSEYTLPRNISSEIIIKTYRGLKVPRQALRVNENGESGVYCLSDTQVKFKPVEIIFEKDSYYIVAYDTDDTKGLLLYDEIIVSTKQLSDRKVVK